MGPGPPKGPGGKKGGGSGKGGPLTEQSWEEKKAQMEAIKANLARAKEKKALEGGDAAKAKKAKRRKRAKKSVLTRAFERVFGSSAEVKLNRKSREMVTALMLTDNELRELKRQFDEVDLDGAGEMDFDEFFELINEPRSPFTDSIFSVVNDPGFSRIEQVTAAEIKRQEELDGPGSAVKVRGSLTFDDFVQLACTFCMYSHDDMIMFCFTAFDTDNSGVIDENEFLQLCVIVNNEKPTYPDNFRLALGAFKKESSDGMLSLEEFVEVNDKFPLVLFPVFRFQDSVMKKLLGRGVWMDVARRVLQEREADGYRRTHNGEDKPLTFSEKYLSCFKRQRYGKKRARKPPSAKDTALRMAAVLKTQQSSAGEAASDAAALGTDKSGPRRVARGKGAVGALKMQEVKKR